MTTYNIMIIGLNFNISLVRGWGGGDVTISYIENSKSSTWRNFLVRLIDLVQEKNVVNDYILCKSKRDKFAVDIEI